MQSHSLVRRFADAGLPLVLSERPLVVGLGGRGARDIVQIDIARKTNGSRRQEWFRLYLGAEENRVEVVGLDKNFGQVVVMIHEPDREFFEQIPWGLIHDIDFAQPDWVEAVARKVSVRPEAVFVSSRSRGPKGRPITVSVKRRTPSAKRHILAGLDERQLFLAQLPRGVSGVREAHDILKSGEVTLAEGRGIKAVRQGEWFFLEANGDEVRRLEDGLARNLLILERSVPIGPFTDRSARMGGARRVRQFRGNPHTADELVVLPGSPVGNGFPVRERDVFIRGRVRHIDHATVTFSAWHKVIRNAEANAGQAFGGWVD